MLTLACTPAPPDVSADEPVEEKAVPVPTPRKRLPWARGSQAPSLWSDGGDLHLVWIEDGESEPRVRYARFRDDWWSDATTIVAGADLVVNWADTPQIAQGGDGALYVSWPQKNGEDPYAYDVMLARSSDEGRSWKSVGIPHRDGTKTEHGFVSMAPSATGVEAIWLDGRATAIDGPMALRGAAIGDKVGPTVQLDGDVCDCCSTDLAITSEGPIAVYRDREKGEVRDIGVVRREGDQWAVPSRVARDGFVIAGCPVNGPRVWAQGRYVAVIWYTAHPEPAVRFATSRDGGRSFGRPMRFADASTLGRVDLVSDSRSWVILTWMDLVDDHAVIRASRFHLTGRTSKPYDVAIVDPSRASGFPRAAVVDGGLFVVWTDVERQTLEYEIVPLDELKTGS